MVSPFDEKEELYKSNEFTQNCGKIQALAKNEKNKVCQTRISHKKLGN